MKALVTGAAGFIGSHLCERLLDGGREVVGLDALTDYYDPAIKRRNLARLSARPGFHFQEADLARADLAPILDGVGAVFHLAAQPGVRSSWGADFAVYLERNVLATQRLLDSLVGRRIRLIFASSSSVYGDAATLPTFETAERRPISPYGATKAACEDLLRIYSAAHGVESTALRFFTVYGPRQRPDMAFQRLLLAAAQGKPFTVYGDGGQSRDVTFVGDAVEAAAAAEIAPGAAGETFNIASGSTVLLSEILEHVRTFARPGFTIQYAASGAGDARATSASIEKAARILGYAPKANWKEGIEKQWLEVRNR